MKSLARRFRRAIQRYGVIGTLELASQHIVSLAIRLRPSDRAEIRESQQRAAAFDKQYGVDTVGCIHPTKLNINNPNQLHAVSYGGSDPKLFREIIGTLPINYQDFMFIDFGSGKGRAILLATEFPFKRVVGVEFSEELHRIAQDNIRRFNRSVSRCQDVDSVCVDATDYPLPDECLVCYFCNPFDATIMARVVANIRNSFLRRPRDIFIVYYNPKEGHLVDKEDCFMSIGTNNFVPIWRTKSELQERKE
jgi:SAM-dependent methyltransferase